MNGNHARILEHNCGGKKKLKLVVSQAMLHQVRWAATLIQLILPLKRGITQLLNITSNEN